jgi:hypothetical protein
MSTKMTHRRIAAREGRGRNSTPLIPALDFIAWSVTDANGIDNTVYTLGGEPEGYTMFKRNDA